MTRREIAEQFCRHNGIPYKGGCGSLASNTPAVKAARHARERAAAAVRQMSVAYGPEDYTPAEAAAAKAIAAKRDAWLSCLPMARAALEAAAQFISDQADNAEAMQAASGRRNTSKQPKRKLTTANIATLVRLRDGGGWKTPLRSTMGGAIRRMLDRLADDGLVDGPPFVITELGIERLRELGK